MGERVLIKLSEAEQQTALTDGKRLYDNKIRNGKYKAPVGTKYDPWWYDILGIAGEMALHKHLNRRYDFELFHERDNGDLVIGGLTADLKTKPYYKNEWLEVRDWHTTHASKQHIGLYILINRIYKLETFELIGYAFKPESFDQPPWEKFAYPGKEANPVYRLHRYNLQRPEFLRTLEY